MTGVSLPDSASCASACRSAWVSFSRKTTNRWRTKAEVTREFAFGLELILDGLERGKDSG